MTPSTSSSSKNKENNNAAIQGKAKPGKRVLRSAKKEIESSTSSTAVAKNVMNIVHNLRSHAQKQKSMSAKTRKRSKKAT